MKEELKNRIEALEGKLYHEDDYEKEKAIREKIALLEQLYRALYL